MDPFYVNLGEQKFKYGMLAVDIFTKQVEVVPMMLKDKDNILAAFFELFKKLGGNPKMVYSDNDTAIDAPIVQQWFKDQNIKIKLKRAIQIYIYKASRSSPDDVKG